MSDAPRTTDDKTGKKAEWADRVTYKMPEPEDEKEH